MDGQDAVTSPDEVLCNNVEIHPDSLSATIPGIVYVLDEDGNFTYTSESISSTLGYSANELLGSHFSAIIFSEDFVNVSRNHVLPHFSGVPTGNSRAPKLFDERRSHPRRTASLKMRLLARSKQTGKEELVSCKVNASGQYRQGNTGERCFCGTVGVIYDIVEDDLDGLTIETGKRYNPLDLLSQALSHTFSNMFTGIYGNLQLIEMQLEPDNKFTANIEAIKHSVEKAVTLIKRMSVTVTETEKRNNAVAGLIDCVAEEVFGLSDSKIEYVGNCRLLQFEADPDYVRNILKAVFSYIRSHLCNTGPVVLKISDLQDTEGKLPLFGYNYIKIEVTFQFNGAASVFGSCNLEGCNEGLEKITALALSYSLLKKIGAALEVWNSLECATVWLYLPALS